MRTCFKGVAAAALLLVAASLPGHAEDAPAPAATATPAAPAAAPPADAKPAVAQRPSLKPQANDATPEATTEPPPRQHRRHARHNYYRHYAYGYWEPFPIYFPHLYHSRIVWNRVPWF